MAGRAPQASGPGEVGRPAGGRRSRGCPDAGQAGRCLSASSGPRWECPSSRSSGHPASARPVSRRPVSRRPVSRRPVSRCPDGQASGVRGAAAALSAPRWTPEWLGVAGRPGRAQRVDVPPWATGGVVACLHRAGREGMVRRWPCLARMRSTVARAAAWPASGCGAALAPAADMGAGPGPGCRPGSREHGWSRCSPAPAGVLGRSLAWCRQWPGPGGDDHAGWSLGEDGPVASSSGGPTRFGGGAACGRGAAAGREERCPLGAYRSLTSENSGGRDRV
jgi:hypothetical protein